MIAAIDKGDRLFAMDVIRGVAVLGILLMNIPGFAGNEFSIVWNDVLAHKLTLNGFIYKSALVLFEGKMRGLFTLLFGAGLLLFIENKKTNSIEVADAYMRRMMWLLAFGIVDGYLLLWNGDVLYEYALCGLFLFAFRNLKARYLLIIGCVAISITTIKTGMRYHEYRQKAVVYIETSELLKQGKTLTEDQKKTREEFGNVLQHHYPFSKKVAEEVRNDFQESYIVHHSGYPEIFEKHSEDVFEYQTTGFYTGFYESFGTILIGMVLYKLGFFRYRFRLSTYRLFCFLGIPVGIVLVIISHKLQSRTQAELWHIYSWRPFSTFYLESPARLMMIIGYASALLLLCRLQAFHKFLTLFSNVGRMALTNYLMQTILCSFYFFGFGLGHYAEYDATRQLIFVICIWVTQITYSNLYLHYFNMGPAEWLWKKLTYGKALQKKTY